MDWWFYFSLEFAAEAVGGSLIGAGCGGGAVSAYVNFDDELSISPATPAAAD